MAKLNLTMQQQLEILNDMGYFPSEEEQTSEKVAEIYAEVQQEQEKLAEGIDDPDCVEEHTEEEEGKKMLEEIRAKEREEFKLMTLEQLLANRAITKARIREELVFLGVKPGCSLSREELMSLWFNKMHESKVIVGEVKEVVDTPKEEQIIPPPVENSPVIPPEPKQEDTIQNNAVIPPTQETTSQQEESSDAAPESKPAENTQPAKEWKVKKAEKFSEIIEYILWRQKESDKVYSKAFVGTNMMNIYVKQKGLGKPTGKDCVFTEQEEQQVKKAIEVMVQNKYIKAIYRKDKADDTKKELSGYIINPGFVAQYYYSKKLDVVYQVGDNIYVIDFAGKFRADMKTGKLLKLDQKVWDYLFDKGKFIGVITRDDNQVFTKFEALSTNDTNNDSTPPTPIVPTEPVVPQ